MKRSTVVIDRLGCAIAGSALIGVGLTSAAWERGQLPAPPASRVTMPWLSSAPDTAWWPIGLGAAAIVLILIGLGWLFSHRPGQKLGSVTLPGGDATGRLGVDVDSAATSAAADLDANPSISAAKGTTRIDRGHAVIELDVTIDAAPASLAAAAEAARGVHRDIAEALHAVPHTSRVLLRVPRHRRGAARVR